MEASMSLVPYKEGKDHKSSEIKMLNMDDQEINEMEMLNKDEIEFTISKIVGGRPVGYIPGIILADPEWMRLVRARLKIQKSCTIFEVPDNIGNLNVKAYEPQVVSIGPYHYFNLKDTRFDHLKNYKWRCVQQLVSRNTRVASEQEELIKKCMMTLFSLHDDVKSCYFDKYKMLLIDDQAVLMLQDGCFILTLLLNLQKEGEDELPVPETMWRMVQLDLLKLENQIPFFVLQLLFMILMTPEDEDVNLVDKALEFFNNLWPKKVVTFKPSRTMKFHHLLHLFHSSLLLDIEEYSKGPKPTDNIVDEESLIRAEWIPNATELDMSGVKLRSKRNASCLLDITFEKGVLEIPRLEARDHTETLFRNLIAFEQSYPNTGMQLTTYALFMDCIVDKAEDVNLLQSKGIIVNRLSTEDAVADLFNNLCKEIHYSLDKNYLCGLFIQVIQYHGRKWHRYRAGLVRDYFSNPWAIISLVAAAILLMLTVVQSYFAAYAYFKPT